MNADVSMALRDINQTRWNIWLHGSDNYVSKVEEVDVSEAISHIQSDVSKIVIDNQE